MGSLFAAAWAAALAWHFSRGPSRPLLPRERLELIQEIGPIRPVEARLVGLEYAAWRGTPTRYAGRVSPETLRRIAYEARSDRSRLADLALINLVFGRLPEAIAGLEEATHGSPPAGRLVSDLGAVYLARASARNDPSDIVLALDFLQRAIELDPGLCEARFNLALALEKFFLFSQASTAWTEYLRLDPDSEWATEARRHLAAPAVKPESATWPLAKKELLTAAARGDSLRVNALVDRWRRQARRLVEEDLLGEWGKDYVSGRHAEAASALKAAHLIAAALARVEGDNLAYDAITAIDSARSAAALGDLAEGHAAVADGLALSHHGQDSGALSAFKTGVERLKAAGSPFQSYALLRLTISNNGLTHDFDTLEELEPLRRTLDRQRYPALAGSVLWFIGLAHLKLSHFTASLGLYREALSLFARTGEQESIAALHSLTGENLRLQGEASEAWKQRWQALARARDLDLSPWFHNALFDAAEAALDQHQPRAALLFHNEMVERAKHTRDPVDVVESLVRRSRAFSAVGDREASLRDLGVAEQWVNRIEDKSQHGDLAADVVTMYGETSIRQDPRDAARKIGEAIDFYRAGTDRLRLPELYQKQADAYLAANDTKSAEASLLAGISQYEDASQHVTERELGITYRDQVRLLYDQMVHLQVERNRPAEAFSYFERSRAKALLRDLAYSAEYGSKEVSPLSHSLPTFEVVQSRLPRRAALLEYVVLSDQVLAWCLTPENVRFLMLGPRSEIAAQIQALRKDLAAGTWGVHSAAIASGLYRSLLEPFEAQLSTKSALIVIPDRELFELPFAALVKPATGQFLVESFVLTYTPSTTVYLGMADRAALRDSSISPASTVTIIGDPDFDKDLFPDLPRLARANAEARKVASLYTDGHLLVGARATKRSFINALLDAELVHYAGHARLDSNTPLLSGFVLAAEQDGDRRDLGFLTAREIYSLRGLHARLLVLGACSTTDGPLAGSEGLINLVRPLLAAGVSTTIGSLWTVDDKAGEQLMVELHRHLQMGEGAADALRSAQSSLLKSEDTALHSPVLWAGFQAIGSGR